MLPKDQDTIVAEATPMGRAGVGVIRISGSQVQRLALNILGKVPEERKAEFLAFKNPQGETVDQGLALYFKSPRSFTGEDVLELQGHGSPAVLKQLLEISIHHGARVAEPGEFSLRAFLNNKIDLLQAEAIADLISAPSTQAARSAYRTLEGEFSRRITVLTDRLIHLRMQVEASIDFPEEALDLMAQEKIKTEMENLKLAISQILETAQQSARFSEGARVVIAGKPNAGKSSLFNLLSGRDSAIVTKIPGTTRDTLKEELVLEGRLIELIDTAGIRETQDEVEQQGIARSRSVMKTADHLIWVVDASEICANQDRSEIESISELALSLGLEPKATTLLYNKIDILGGDEQIKQDDAHTEIYLSAKTTQGMELLRQHLKFCLGQVSSEEGNFLARKRHIQALKLASVHLNQGIIEFQHQSLELAAEELRLTQNALDEISGKITSDDLLGKIFSEFCIGK